MADYLIQSESLTVVLKVGSTLIHPSLNSHPSKFFLNHLSQVALPPWGSVDMPSHLRTQGLPTCCLPNHPE